MTRADLAVWAPDRESVELRVRPAGAAQEPARVPMERDASGWWHPAEPLPGDGTGEYDYGYCLDGSGSVLPDPRSRRQPEGVHGLSRTVDLSGFGWTDARWTGRQLAGGVVYEMHVGTFTPDGTLDAAIGKLDHLVELGVDFVELLPVNGFNGQHGWGYDGVLWYTVHEAYGGPEAYARFVDACHARGLAVVQDVVYNHLGPSGNYLPQFGPYLNASGANTWGSSPNLDGPESDEVRRYLLDNVRMWLRDYHVDGLRLDAVHALVDSRAVHILEEIPVEVDVLSASVGRPLPLVAESDLNNSRLITPREGGGYGLTGQWSDDFHHALYVSLTGDTTGYYADFGLPALAKVLERGFFHDGTWSSFRHRSHGRPVDTERMPAWRLVVYADNHDQIGNRATGERLSARLDPAQLGLAAMVTLLSPFTPMIFMGEEWGAATPWQFFTSHPEPELGRAVAEGRRAEFARMEWGDAEVPDPQDPETFRRSTLDWSEPGHGVHADLLALNRRLLEVRRSLSDVTDPRFTRGRAVADDAGWLRLERGAFVLVVNFADTPVEVEVGGSLEPLVEVGEVSADGSRVKLGGHAGLAARRRDS